MYNKIDYTLLKAFATQEDIFKLCNTAIEKKCASVCIPSCYVSIVRENFPTLNICTVIGFPLGNCSTETKIVEIKQAIKDGANEFDFVVNVGWVKNKDWHLIKHEFYEIRKATKGIVKVILETCYLTTEEIIKLCKIAIEFNIDYVKTSTGFGTKGATERNVKIMCAVVKNSKVKVKASGGIRTKEDVEKYLKLGVDRLGISCLP